MNRLRTHGDETGASLVEYALLLALVVLVCVVALRLLGGSLADDISDNTTRMESGQAVVDAGPRPV